MEVMRDNEGGIETLLGVENALEEDDGAEAPPGVSETDEAPVDDPMASLPGLALKPLGAVEYRTSPGGEP